MPALSSAWSAFHTLARDTPSTRAIASPERNSPSASMRRAWKVKAFIRLYRIVDKRSGEELPPAASRPGVQFEPGFFRAVFDVARIALYATAEGINSVKL